MTRTITITSGKGGVGKTSISANLGIQLATMGYRTCVFDADLGLANINIVLGLYPEQTIEDVLLHGIPLRDIILRNHDGIDIVPGSSGVEKIANIAPEQIDAVLGEFSSLDEYDFIFFDTSAGVSKHVVSFCLASTELVLIITPEPTSLTDAYALLKILKSNGLTASVQVIINQCKDTAIAKKTYVRFKDVVKKYLALDIHPLGVVLHDPNVSQAVNLQQACITRYPDTIASKCIRVIANNILQHAPDALTSPGAEPFFKRFIDYFKSSLRLKDVQSNEPGAPEMKSRPEDESASVSSEPHSADRPIQDVPPVSQPADAPPATLHPSPSSAPSSASGTGTPGQSVVVPNFTELITSLSAISQELHQLRKAVETSWQLRSPSVAPRTLEQSASHQPVASDSIALDFELFLQGRMKNEQH